jgi:2-polyprenyl-3-methyl-5-hydroxy-6-metoxy-1,4-benzoquinol methylase
MKKIDWDKILQVNLSSIKFSIRDRFDIFSECTVEDGDWDKNLMPIEELIIYDSIHKMFLENVKWEDTKLFKFILEKVNNGKVQWSCKNREDIIKRGEKIRKLYEEISSQNKIITQRDYPGRIFNPTGKFNDEITVVIDRDGKFIFYNNANHRFSIAKVLNFKTVPVKVYKRHEEWEVFKNFILDFCEKEWQGKTYHPIPHPDFDEVSPMWGDSRYELVKSYISSECKSVLDIGSLFGYMCYKFENDGFSCTAVENSKKYLYIMKKLKDANELKFKIFEDTVFNLQDKEHDVVLALNIFHHFLKTEKSFNSFKDLLSTLKFRQMFVQFHIYDEEQMKNAFCNFTNEQFLEFINQHTGKTINTLIGEENGRKIYLIE